ncbi:HipA family kinase [Metabacillus litoralis]|uniref:HipA family kinase n=1 Tax=Metabacillus litoralis TaxID=152268 RepID=UPI001CFCBA31|nr:HipA family kinase [Metabacillus litoralis]
MEVKEPLKFIRELRTGSSLPIVIQDGHNKEFFVKLSGSGEGTDSLVMEWVANKLALKMSLPVLEPFLLNIRNLWEYEIADIETRELIEKSSGFNLAFPYIKSEKLVDSDFIDKDNQLLFLFFWDCFLINIDRTPHNLNLLKGGNKMIAIDYGFSFLLKKILSHSTVNISEQFLQQLKQHPFIPQETYDLKLKEFVLHLQSISLEDISHIIQELPEKWLNIDEKLYVAKQLWEKIQHPAHMYDILRQLPNVKVVTNQEAKLQRLVNRDQFVEKIKNKYTK